MAQKDLLYGKLNEGILVERLGAFRRNLKRNRALIDAHGGLKRIVPALNGTTALVIGAGPSLERNFDLLRKYQHRQELTYIAVDMALRPLMKRGIEPRYVFSCESVPVDFFGGLDTSHAHLVAFSCASHINLRKWRGEVSFYNWMIDRPEYRELWEEAGTALGFVATGSLVITQAVAFALGCGIRGLVLVGNDLGFTDRFYAGGSAAGRSAGRAVDRLAPVETGEISRARRAMQYRIDRGGRSYYTNAQFLAGKMWLEDLFRKSRVPIYDCSDPGCSEKYVAKMELRNFMYSMDGRNRRKRRKE
ncbi:MAG: DUF115 domain-containing protein [Spirochaetes bacterium]|nr:DUF115 domain-containing protein [Spirochaetota bacterium]